MMISSILDADPAAAASDPAVSVLLAFSAIALVMMAVLPAWNWLRRGTTEDSDAVLGRVFRLSPEAMTLTCFDDGKILEVSQGMCALTGYTREEMVGRTTTEMNLWADPAQRQAVRAGLDGAQETTEALVRVRRKNGSEVDTSFVAKKTDVDGRRCIISSARALPTIASRTEETPPASLRSEGLMVIALPAGDIVDLNAGFCEQTGWQRADAVGRSLMELKLWVEASEGLSMMATVTSGPSLLPTTYQLCRKDGSVFAGLVTGLRAEIGGRTCAFITLANLTGVPVFNQARRRYENLERLISTASARFLDLHAHQLVSGLTLTLSELGRILDIDRCQVLRFGKNQNDLRGLAEWTQPGVPAIREVLEPIPIAAQTRWRRPFLPGDALMLASVAACDDADLRAFFAPFGTTALLDLPMLHAGQTLGFLSLAMIRGPRDWSPSETPLLLVLAGIMASAVARCEAELKRAEREQRLSIILDSIGDAVVAVDADGLITRINPVAARLATCADKDIIGRSFAAAFTVLDATTGRERGELLELARQDRLIPTGNTRIRDREGREHAVQEGGAPLRGPDGQVLGLVLVFRDVSDQRRLEDMLRQSHKMDAMGQLAGGVAHDFNNMLAGILGFAELLTARLAGQDEEEKLARRIVRTAERAAGLTRQLLAFSRKGRLVSRNIDLGRIIDDTLGILRRTIDPRIAITTELTAERAVITGDPALVENALLNLSLNARDAMPEGGRMRVSTHNRFLALGDPLLVNFSISPGDYVEIAISDTGTGMTSEVLSKLFVPFFTTKERGKGTGLGLAAVYGIMRDHQGAVAAESVPEQGSVFRLFFPTAHSQVAIETGLHRRPNLGSGCVLVIDDETVVRDMATLVLQDLGYEVLGAADGPEGLDLFALHRQRIGLVLLDLVMPRMHGSDVLIRLRQIDADIPVLLTSGYAQDSNLEEMLAQAQVDFIQKPYRLPELGQRVSEMIRGN